MTRDDPAAVDDELAALLTADQVGSRWVAAQVKFGRRARLLREAESDGLLDYLTCPACRALVPLGPPGEWPDTCPRCRRCVGC